MKRLLWLIPILGVCILAIGITRTASASLPDSLSTHGYGPYESPLIQPSQSPWYITLNYTPLNASASVTIINQDRTLRDYKLVPTRTSGNIIYEGQGTTPMYVEAYAGTWSVTLSY